jgi:ATP:ADP antiporter, AAA family
MKNRWRNFLDTKAGEGRLVTALLLHSLFMGISLVFFETAASALFLARFQSENLPYVFIGVAFAVPLSGVLYNRLRSRLSTQHLWIGTLLFLAAVPLAMAAVLYISRAVWPALILMTLVNVMYALTALEFWGVAGRVFDLRQARRLYGLIGSGEVAAGIIGGIAVGPILKIISVTNLLLAAAAGFFLCLLFLLDLLRTRGDYAEESDDEDEATNQSVLGLLRAVVNDRYIMLFVGLYLFYNLTHDTLEYTNLSQIQAYFHQNEKQVAVFIGGLLSARELITLTVRTLFSGWLLNRFGLGTGLTATPTLMMAGSVTIVAVSLAAPQASLFWLVVFLKIAEGTVRNSLGKPALMVAYRPLPPQRRDRAQMVIETAIEPISTGLTGVILLLVNFILAGSTPAQKAAGTGLLLLATAGGWFAMGWLLRHEYTKVVMAALSRGTLRAAVLSLDEPTLVMLTKRLRSSHAREVIYLLRVMQENTTPARLTFVMFGLLDHPDPDVRAAVLGQIEAMRLSLFLPALTERLEREAVPHVRAAQLLALAAGGDVDVLDRISPSLQDPDPLMRRSALAGLLKYGGVPGVLQAGERLLALLQAPKPADRIMAAELVGDVGILSFSHTLRQLLADPDPGVRVAAIGAAGTLRHARLWPELARHLALPQFWHHASRALVAGGDGAVPTLEELLLDPEASQRTRIRAVRVLGRIRTPTVVTALRHSMDHPELRAEAVQALQDCKYRATGEAALEIDADFRREIERAAGLNAALVDVGRDDNAAVLWQTLRQELARSQNILFSLLSFLYDPDTMRQARTYWRSGSGDKKALALEVLDNLCERRHKAPLLPLVEGLSPEAAYRKLNKEFPQSRLGPDGRLAEILTAPPAWATTWVRVWAAYVLGRAAIPPAEGLLEGRLADADPLVREAARFALDQLRAHHAKEQTMLLTIEKVLLLKSVEFFSTTDDDVLAELAELATEVTVKAGERIVRKGEVGSSMYIVASGKVRRHDGERYMAEIGPGGVFGELAALDSQPRNSDITAETDLVLLKIDHATVVDLMSEHIEVAHGIIRYLIRRCRLPATG